MIERYLFYEGTVPCSYHVGFEAALFNHQAHRKLQSSEGWHSYYILDQKSKSIVAAIHFHISDGVARSPLRSPFGSVEFAAGVPEAVLFGLLQYCETSLRAKGALRIVIKNCPQAYNEAHAVFVHTFLLNLSYSIARAEVGVVIDIKGAAPEALYHRSERRRLNKARLAGLIFKRMEQQDYDAVFTFIQRSRAEKNYTLSMTANQFRESFSCFPNHYLVFGVFQGDVLAAASIAIRVKEDVLYDFYHDHTSAFDHLSPVVLLVAGMYDFCYQHNIRLLDLGTSATDGRPNFSLLTFKKFLGGSPTHKLTFEKILTHG